MKLDVREAARLLAISESEVYRRVEAGEIPCDLVNHQPKFSPAELLEWATARRLPVSLELFEDADEDAGAEPPRLAEALARGGVHQQVPGADPAAALGAVVARLPVTDPDDRALLTQILLAREGLGATAIGDGIAIPHVRSPLVFPGRPPSVTVCFLATPLPPGAVDGQPVHTLFVLLSATIRGHLQILSRLSRALLDPGFKAAVERRAPSEALIREARRIDETLAR